MFMSKIISIFALNLNYASGKPTINENERIKISEFIPWNRGGMV